MHVETLKTFCDLVETGSLSRAARLNLVSQSAVSQQLRALERRYGRRLIERAPRIGAKATEAGRLLYEEVKPLLDRLGHARAAAARAAGRGRRGTVRVATVYSVGLHTLPPTIKRCLAEHPEVNVRLSYRRTNEVVAACLDGEVDFGIVAVPTRRPGLELVSLGHDELVIAAPPTHPSARRAPRPSPRWTASPSSASTATSPPAGWWTGSCVAIACACTTPWSSTISRPSSGRSRRGWGCRSCRAHPHRGDPRAHAGRAPARRGAVPPAHRRDLPAHARDVGGGPRLPHPTDC
jgi:DNA-binding transcriptional LysR family regulator